ncbi:MAG: hypothetical protein H7Y31_02815 [Chitinophagaceae bacterium]|nr:hypothetical protein [Chitinophagaceae bacterium]
MKEIAHWFTIIILSFVVITHLLRLIYLVFRPKLLTDVKFISAPPPKTRLILYYLLIILVLTAVVLQKLGIGWGG